MPKVKWKQIEDVLLSTPTNGQVMTYNGTNWVNATSAGTDHGGLTGLLDDDHSQYLTEGRADTWFLGKSHTDLLDIGSLSHANIDEMATAFIGAVVETIDIDVDASGATIEFTLQGTGATDLTVITANGLEALDTTPALSVTLTAGSSTVPQLNYVYLLHSTMTLTNSTSAWPSGDHSPIATVLVLDKTTTNSDGAVKVHAYTDHLHNGGGGHFMHLGKRIRIIPAAWQSGVAVTTVPALAASGATVNVTTTSGEVFQMHPHTYPAITGSSAGHLVVNHPTSYTRYTNLASAVVDSENVSLTNKHYSLVIWGVVSEKSGDCQLMVNLPSGSYNSQNAADRDADRHANYTIPADYAGTGFLIARLVIRNTSGTSWTMNVIDDLRGLLASTSAGGGAGITSHSDLTSLTTDDHTQYALLAGRSTGQTLIGGTDSGDDLILTSTSDATKGDIKLDSTLYVLGASNKVGINIPSPTEVLEVNTNTDIAAIIGRARVGYCNSTDTASFSHIDMSAVGNVAIHQQATGTTWLNCKTGQDINFSVNSAIAWQIDGSNFHLESFKASAQIKATGISCNNADPAFSFTSAISTGMYLIAGPKIGFTVSGTKVMDIDSTGINCVQTLEVEDNIKFPATQVPSADVNTLDDYEEGTWTPEFRDSAGNVLASGNHTKQAGTYTKIGNLVQFSVRIQVITSYSPMVATNGIRIYGLPFSVSITGDIRDCFAVGYGASLVITAGQALTGHAVADYLRLRLWDSTIGVSDLLVQEVGISGDLMLSGTYRAT